MEGAEWICLSSHACHFWTYIEKKYLIARLRGRQEGSEDHLISDQLEQKT